MSRPGKEASGRVHEKHQLILADLLREEDNRFCADCLSKGPRWASWNLGVFMCIRCAGIHRNLGVHISRVKSVNLDAWTPEQIESIQKGGNKKAKEFYEANLPSNFRRPQDDYAVETFIRNKYERRMYVLKDAPKEGSRTKDKEKTKQVKKSENRDELKLNQGKQKVSLPRPASTSNLSRPRPPGSPQSRPRNTANLTVPSSSGRSQSEADLIALEKKSSKTPTLDLLTDLPSPSAAVAEQPMLGMEPQTSVKDGIMSLYNSRPQYGSYTAQGYPVNAYYAQQQRAAAVRMAQQQQVQQQQVQLVQQQMEQLKLRQQQRPVAIATGHASGTASGGGQTLNPHLW